jgi:hypothetical protein
VATIIRNEGTARHYGLLTPETVSDDELRGLYTDERVSLSKVTRAAIVGLALGNGASYSLNGAAMTSTEAKGRCVEVLNARAKADRGTSRSA